MRLFRAPPAPLPDAGAPGIARATLVGAFATTFLLTLSNPITLLSFAAVFAGLGLGAARGDVGGAVALVAGVFLGSAGWWLLLSSTVGALRHRVTPRGLRCINRGSGTIVLAFAAWAMASAIRAPL